MKSSLLTSNKLSPSTKYDIMIKKCDICLMKYNKLDPVAAHRHKEFHDVQTKGLKWAVSNYLKNSKFALKPLNSSLKNSRGTRDIFQMLSGSQHHQPLTPENSQRSTNFNPQEDSACGEYIIEIQKENVQEVKLALQLLDFVNEELTAPKDENDFWISGNGKCFVFIKDGRAVGVITLEDLVSTHYTMKWMILSTKEIVEHVNPRFLAGVSRIWVSKQYRRNGIALKLLETARRSFCFGVELKPLQIAWSQPSESGSKTAKKFNSVLHKSGELLIPVYF
ncbi:hypothetical protein ACO0RG_004707 [Hanseniaspora osmophila]